MAKYSVEISATAEKELKKLGRDDEIRLLRRISLLADDPRPDGCRKMSGYDHLYRIRVGRYRVIYEIDGENVIVIVLKIGHRRDNYPGTWGKPRSSMFLR